MDAPKKYVVHCKKEKYDVYIGRPGPWGNPYSHLPGALADFKVATRAEAIAAYEAWIRARPILVARAQRELKGKILGCWCAPKPCHGEVLVKIANEPI
jgi:hypothetical protein